MFWFFGDFRCDVLLFIVILVIVLLFIVILVIHVYKYRNR